MSLTEQLNEDMKLAMKSKDKKRLAVIRMIKSSLQNEAIKLGKENLLEEDELNVLSKELKQRKDSLQDFKSAGRDDLVNDLEEEIKVVQEYMPQQLSEDELEKLVISTIEEIGASSKQDMGKVMSTIMPRVKGKADGALINQLVQKHLQ